MAICHEFNLYSSKYEIMRNPNFVETTIYILEYSLHCRIIFEKFQSPGIILKAQMILKAFNCTNSYSLTRRPQNYFLKLGMANVLHYAFSQLIMQRYLFILKINNPVAETLNNSIISDKKLFINNNIF